VAAEALSVAWPCASSSELGQTYSLIGKTASEAPIYASADRVYYIYHDRHCDSEESSGRWIIDIDEPNRSAEADLDNDGDCSYLGKVMSEDKTGPPTGTKLWDIFCDGAWQSLDITIFLEALTPAPTSAPTGAPAAVPNAAPTTSAPTAPPTPKLTAPPTEAPTTSAPTSMPTSKPTASPSAPAVAPTHAPTSEPKGAAESGKSWLIEAAQAGDTTLQVATLDGFSEGDFITIAGGGSQETRRIASFGSIMLDQPTERAYPVGSEVTWQAAPPADGEPYVERFHGHLEQAGLSAPMVICILALVGALEAVMLAILSVKVRRSGKRDSVSMRSGRGGSEAKTLQKDVDHFSISAEAGDTGTQMGEPSLPVKLAGLAGQIMQALSSLSGTRDPDIQDQPNPEIQVPVKSLKPEPQRRCCKLCQKRKKNDAGEPGLPLR